MPSALSVDALALMLSDATDKLAATGVLAAGTGELAVAAGATAPDGVPAFPPPPPQATKANDKPNEATHLMKFIRIFP